MASHAQKTGIIPSSWKTMKMGDLFDFKNGVNADKTQYGSGVRFINIMEVINHDTLTEELIPGRVTLDEKMIEKNKVEYGDVLFNRTSETPEEIGLTSIYLGRETVVFGGFVIRARAKTNDLSIPFRKYCFAPQAVRAEIVKHGQGAVRSNIGQEDLRDIPIQIPCSREQDRIVSVLETWDKAIQQLTQKIEMKKGIKKGLMQKLLTGKTRLHGFIESWKTRKLGEISFIKKGDSITKKDVIAGDVPVIAGGQKPAYFHNVSNRTEKTITVSASGAYAGYVNFYNQPIFVSDCTSIQERSANIDFIYLVLKLKQAHIYTLQSGGAQPHVQPSDLRGIRISVPESKEEQRAIASILSTAEEEIEILERKLKALQDQKKYLLNNLITGMIRIPESIELNR